MHSPTLSLVVRMLVVCTVVVLMRCILPALILCLLAQLKALTAVLIVPLTQMAAHSHSST